MSNKASFWETLEDGRIRCGLCPHNCSIEPSQKGDCLTRTNSGGKLTVDTYGSLSAAADDPVEKKPLFHFQPGTRTFSIASAGCNLVCPFCQNHGLSQALRCEAGPERSGNSYSPSEVVDAAQRSGCSSISFTYSEPILQFEFARDVAAIAKPAGVDIIFVSNGQVQKKPARELARFVNAANVDLKCFDAGNYKKVLGGSLGATKQTIETFVELGVWVEVTTLVIPGFNDSDEELAEIARFIKDLGSHIPWHVSRFHPDYRWLDVKPTPVETVARAREIGLEQGLLHVYVGNLPGDDGEKTHCSECKTVVIDRRGYRIIGTAVREGACATCGELIAGVGIK